MESEKCRSGKSADANVREKLVCQALPQGHHRTNREALTLFNTTDGKAATAYN